jgi:RimJ/RimL family protein N-acetyltransferase
LSTLHGLIRITILVSRNVSHIYKSQRNVKKQLENIHFDNYLIMASEASAVSAPADNVLTTTTRLSLIPFEENNSAHADFLYKLWSTPLFIAAHGGAKVLATPEAALSLIKSRFLKEYEVLGHGTYILQLNTEVEIPNLSSEELEKLWPGRLIGTVGLTRGMKPGSMLIPDIGFGTVPELTGQGIATEAVKGLNKWAIEVKKLDGVFGFCDPGNTGSRKVMEKAGMILKDDKRKLPMFGPNVVGCVFVLPGMNEDLSVYGLQA